MDGEQGGEISLGFGVLGFLFLVFGCWEAVRSCNDSNRFNGLNRQWLSFFPRLKPWAGNLNCKEQED